MSKWKALLLIVVLLNLTMPISAQNKSSLASSSEVASLPLAELAALPSFLPKIDRQPSPANYHRGALTVAPTYNESSEQMWQMDLRCYDLTKLDLQESAKDLIFATFDSRTKWPPANRMPSNYDWKSILEIGRNPGLGIRQLHAKGITGRGVGIAIIDQPLILNHVEYANQLCLYEEINVKPTTESQMHGPAVASIAVGKSTGVAPEADLYYIGAWTGDWGVGQNGFTYNFVYYSQAIRRILEINKMLPDNRKIRVISMQTGWNPNQKGYKEITAAMNDAKSAGLLVVSSSLEETFGFKFHGLGRSPLSDPDRIESYEPGLFWRNDFYDGGDRSKSFYSGRLMIPMDSRTTASPCGADEYVFYREGGWSWSIPYIAGVYALAAQTKPSITPDKFWNLALQTAKTIDVTHKGKAIAFGPILDPIALMAGLQKGIK